MKIVISGFLFFAFFVNCNQKKENNIYAEQLDYAKYELYKLNSYMNCNCLAVNIPNRYEDIDTLLVLSADIELDSVAFQSDTIIYYFNYIKNEKKKESLRVLSSVYTGCFHYYAIAFKKTNALNKEPIFALINELSFFPYTKQKRKEINEGFEKCLQIHKHNINTWLNQYIKNKIQ